MKNREKKLEIAREIAKARGGECLSTTYEHSHAKMLWKCANANHNPWSAIYNNVVNLDTWCPECNWKSKENSHGLDKAKACAIAKGGECLSTEYKNSYSKMKWKCSNSKHKPWEATYSNVVNLGSWCRECQYENNGLETAHEQAKAKGGTCLSTTYKHSNEKMLWKCSNPNHEPWHAPYTSVVHSGSWCRKCSQANRPKNTQGLEIAKETATKRDGVCLSTEYTGNHDKMLWKCGNPNHKPWHSRYSSVINQKTWCPECANNIKKETKND